MSISPAESQHGLRLFLNARLGSRKASMSTATTTTIEDNILSEFVRKSKHLRNQAPTQSMQRELLDIATPYHTKLKELGYPAQLSKAMLRKAFDHQPAFSTLTLLGKAKLHIF
jgi:hypothetical protein